MICSNKQWDSGLTIINKNNLTVKIPFRLYLLFKQLSKRIDEEFLVLTNAEIKNNTIILSDEFYIPSQIVSMGSVSVTENCNSYNAVLHKHPSGCRDFSSTDEEFINSNYLISILYVDNEFTKAVVNFKNFKKDDFIIQIETSNIEIDHEEFNIEDIIEQKIKKETVIVKRMKKKKKKHKYQDDEFLRGRIKNLIVDYYD